jgi:hypothetical protein
MTYLQSECTYTGSDSLRRFNIGRVPVLNTLPQYWDQGESRNGLPERTRLSLSHLNRLPASADSGGAQQ